MANTQPVDDTAATVPEETSAQAPEAQVTADAPTTVAPLTIEDRMSVLEHTVAQGLATLNANFQALVAHVSNPPPQPSPVYRYDGPSSEIQFTIKQGEEFLMTDRLAQLFNPLLANGHQFTRVS